MNNIHFVFSALVRKTFTNAQFQKYLINSILVLEMQEVKKFIIFKNSNKILLNVLLPVILVQQPVHLET